MIEVEKIAGLGEFNVTKIDKNGDMCYNRGIRAFLILRKHTLEVRCDRELAKLLTEKYESVMESRYFGRGGIEIVNSGQLQREEIEDLIRLSYNLSEKVD